MSENTLDFIRDRKNRQSVTPRGDALFDPVSDSGSLDSSVLKAIQAQLDTLPSVVRRSNIRIAEGVLERAEALFKKERITLETFFEAAYELASREPEIMMRVLDDAKRRKKDRDRAGQLKRDLARLKTY